MFAVNQCVVTLEGAQKTHDAHRRMQRLADRLREFAAVRTKGIAGLHQFAAAATAAEYFWLHCRQLLCDFATVFYVHTRHAAFASCLVAWSVICNFLVMGYFKFVFAVLCGILFSVFILYYF